MSISETEIERSEEEKLVKSKEKEQEENRLILLKTLVVMIQQGRFTIEEAVEEIQSRPEEFLALLEKGI